MDDARGGETALFERDARDVIPATLPR